MKYIFNLSIEKAFFLINSKSLKSEAVARRCSVKKVFLKISRNSPENTCPRASFLIKLQASACNFIKRETLTATLLKERLWHRCFPVNFAKFLRTPVFIEQSGGCFCKVTLLFKEGDKAFMDNYRTISVLPCFSIILERIIYNRLYSFFTENNILDKKQFGFQKQHLTEHVMFHIIN